MTVANWGEVGYGRWEIAIQDLASTSATPSVLSGWELIVHSSCSTSYRSADGKTCVDSMLQEDATDYNRLLQSTTIMGIIVVTASIIIAITLYIRHYRKTFSTITPNNKNAIKVVNEPLSAVAKTGRSQTPLHAVISEHELSDKRDLMGSHHADVSQDSSGAVRCDFSDELTSTSSHDNFEDLNEMIPIRECSHL